MTNEEFQKLSQQEALDLVERFKYVDEHAYKNAVAYLRNIYEYPHGDWYVLANLNCSKRLHAQHLLYRIYYNNLCRYWWQLTGGDI